MNDIGKAITVEVSNVKVSGIVGTSARRDGG